MKTLLKALAIGLGTGWFVMLFLCVYEGGKNDGSLKKHQRHLLWWAIASGVLSGLLKWGLSGGSPMKYLDY